MWNGILVGMSTKTEESYTSYTIKEKRGKQRGNNDKMETEIFRLPGKTDSYLDSFIHNFWMPEWRIWVIKGLVYHYTNIDKFCEEINQFTLDENGKEEVKELLVTEIVASIMLFLDAFAAIVEGLAINPKDLQAHFREFYATNFWSKIKNEIDYNVLGDILSASQSDNMNSEHRSHLLEEMRKFNVELIKFDVALKRLRDFYFRNLELFNAYKHGYRIFSMSPLDKNDRPVPAIIYFSNKQKKNHASIIKMGRDIDKYLEIAYTIQYFIRVIIKNHQNKLANPDEWEITIPWINEGKI